MLKTSKLISLLLAVTMIFSVFSVAMVSAGAASAGEYFVAGTVNNWKPDDGFKLVKNTAASTDEYMITGVELKTTDQFKIAYSADGSTFADTDWYPTGMGNDYGANGEITADGTYDIYFRPNGDGEADWFNGYFYVDGPKSTDAVVSASITAGGATVDAHVGDTYRYTVCMNLSDLSDGGVAYMVEGSVFYDESKLEIIDDYTDATVIAPNINNSFIASTDEDNRLGYNASTYVESRPFKFASDDTVLITFQFKIIDGGASTITHHMENLGTLDEDFVIYGTAVDGKDDPKYTETLELVDCPHTVEPTEAPATEAPATEAPATEAPATEAPATEAPATEAPATEAPATEAPDKTIVTVKGLDGKTMTQAFEPGTTFTVYTTLFADVPNNALVAVQGTQYYDSALLECADEWDDSGEFGEFVEIEDMFPILSRNSSLVANRLSGETHFNATTTAATARRAFQFPSEDSLLVKTQYKALQPGYVTVYTTLRMLTALNDTAKLVDLGVDRPENGTYVLHMSFYPTGAEEPTEAPATEAPATEAPATEAPATEAPATEAPATEAPVTEEPATEAPAGGYYLVGNMNDWTVTPDAKLTPNDAATTEEYTINFALATDSQFKIVYSADDATATTWFPTGMGNNYGEHGEVTADGTYDIYFRPNYDGGDDWFERCIFVDGMPEPATEAPATEAPATEAPATEAPATEAPATEAPKAKITIYGFDGQFEEQTFTVGDKFTVYTTLNAHDNSKIASINATQTYSKDIIKLIDTVDSENILTDNAKVFPNLGPDTVGRLVEAGTINYHAAGNYNFDSDNDLLIVTTYEVIAGGEGKVENALTILGADDELVTRLYEDGVPADGVVVTEIASFTEPEADQPTEAPATEAPATEAPATEAPATEEPATEEPATEAPAGGYYLVGNMNNWTVTPDAKLTPNDAATTEEYTINFALATDSQFKIVYSADDATATTWFPTGMGNNFGEHGEVTADGTYDIYFRPNYDGGDDWFERCIFVDGMPEPATEAPATEAPATEEPATEAPATEAPATENPSTDAIVNIYDIRGNLNSTKTYQVGDKFPVYTILSTKDINDGKIANVSGIQTYTDSVLKLTDAWDPADEGMVVDRAAMFPVLGDVAYANASISGEISFNASSTTPFVFDKDEQTLIVTNYEVTAAGTADIMTKLDILTAAGDEEMSRIIYNGAVENEGFTEFMSFDPPAEPATEAPATEAPATEAPATEAPATEAPATEAPATEAPATEAPTKAIVKIYDLKGNLNDTREYAINDTVTVYTVLNAADINGGKIAAFSGQQTYSDILTVGEATFPVSGDSSSIANTENDGVIYFNASTPSIDDPFVFDNDRAVLIKTTYTVNAGGEAEIHTTLNLVGIADELITRVDLENGDFDEHMTFELPEPPATEAPATEEPATEAPATEEPATEAPATEEPATEAPATATITIYGLDGQSETKTLNVGDTFTVYTTLNAKDTTADGKVSNARGEQTYTDSILALQTADNNTMFPILNQDNNVVVNTDQTGRILYNASTPSTDNPFVFDSDDDCIIVTTYEVTAAGEGKIENALINLTGCDELLTPVVKQGEVQPGNTIKEEAHFDEPVAPTEAPATEAPATEAPATEAPATEAPATEAPATEAPATEAPATEAPATEAPATEAPATEAPATEAPATEAPATEAPATEAPATEAPATEAPATEAPATEAPATEAPATEAPATEAPTEAPATDKVYINADGHIYEVNIGDTVTYSYYLNNGGKVCGIDAETTWDTPVLTLVNPIDAEENFPILGDATVYNDDNDGELLYVFSDPNGVDFNTDDSKLFTAQFKIGDDAVAGQTYYITTTLKTVEGEDEEKQIFDNTYVTPDKLARNEGVIDNEDLFGTETTTYGYDEASHTKGSNANDATFTIKATSEGADDSKTFGKFRALYIDGALVTFDNYTKEAGSLVLTLKASYMNDLEVGDHDVTFVFADGEGTGKLTILAPEATEPEETVVPTQQVSPTSATNDQKSNNGSGNGVQTGSPEIAIIFMMILAMAAGVIVFTRKRKVN